MQFQTLALVILKVVSVLKIVGTGREIRDNYSTSTLHNNWMQNVVIALKT